MGVKDFDGVPVIFCAGLGWSGGLDEEAETGAGQCAETEEGSGRDEMAGAEAGVSTGGGPFW